MVVVLHCVQAFSILFFEMVNMMVRVNEEWRLSFFLQLLFHTNFKIRGYYNFPPGMIVNVVTNNNFFEYLNSHNNLFLTESIFNWSIVGQYITLVGSLITSFIYGCILLWATISQVHITKMEENCSSFRLTAFVGCESSVAQKCWRGRFISNSSSGFRW